MAIALDVSQYSGEISEARFQAAKDAGVSRIIVALNDAVLAKRQINAAKAVGLEVQVYVYLYFAHDVVVRVRGALTALENMGVDFVWIDCEDQTHNLTETQLRTKVTAAVNTAQSMGYKAGIYTGAWWWNKWMPNTTSFTHLPLWDAYWDRDPDIDLPRYGGWTKTEMSQHTNDTKFEGIWCDINSYVGATPAPRVDIELVLGGDLVNLSGGSYVGYEEKKHIYNRPVLNGHIVVAVHDL